MSEPNPAAERAEADAQKRGCEYCGEVESEDIEIITKHAGDESIDICAGCLDEQE